MSRDRSLSALRRKKGAGSQANPEDQRALFEREDFDPVEYLNDTLPVLAAGPPFPLGGTGRSRAQPAKRDEEGVSLSVLSTAVNTLVSQLTVQSSALSKELTQMTDDMLRVGGRLGYEVDMLNGDVNGLHEILTEKLQADIAGFTQMRERSQDEEIATEEGLISGEDSALPPELAQLKMLLTVRSRLEAVVKVFGEESFAKEMAEKSRSGKM